LELGIHRIEPGITGALPIVGDLDAMPGATNVIPGRVNFTNRYPVPAPRRLGARTVIIP
jgi:hypothetical protein